MCEGEKIWIKMLIWDVICNYMLGRNGYLVLLTAFNNLTVKLMFPTK